LLEKTRQSADDNIHLRAILDEKIERGTAMYYPLPVGCYHPTVLGQMITSTLEQERVATDHAPLRIVPWIRRIIILRKTNGDDNPKDL